MIDCRFNMARRVSMRWPSVSDFSSKATNSEDNVQIEAFDSPETKPKKRRSLQTVKKRELVRISQSSPSPPLVFRRLRDDLVHISQSQSQSPTSRRSMDIDLANISQSEPAEQSFPAPSRSEGPRPRPLPKTLSEPMVQPKVIFPKNGLANRLSNLLRRQQSDLAIWNHRMKMGSELGRQSVEMVVKKKICENGSCLVCECEKTSISEEKVLVIFKQGTWRDNGLGEGRKFVIFAPYLQLLTDRFMMPVIVGPMFLRVVQ